jgi:ribonucleoside-diphosphate reductase alpha chain
METKERPKELEGKTYKMSTGCGNLYVTINLYEGNVFEVFAKLGKSGGCPSCQLEALTRSISIGIRSGVTAHAYCRTLGGIHCSSPTYSDGEQILSCPDAISKVLKLYTEEAPAESFASISIIKSDVDIKAPEDNYEQNVC